MEVTNPDMTTNQDFGTSSEQFLHAAQIAVKMRKAELPAEFVASALAHSRANRGIYELMAMWEEDGDNDERVAAVADIQELLDDAEAAPQHPTAKPRVGVVELDDIVAKVVAAKTKLRALIDRNGGISVVARRSGIPQPSLSRMLSSGSMPRRTTLYKIAAALDLDETDIASDFTW